MNFTGKIRSRMVFTSYPYTGILHVPSEFQGDFLCLTQYHYLGVAGDSGSGKTTITWGIQGIFGKDTGSTIIVSTGQCT
jgi:ABC-type sulfate/molybdate transport systems ATPase subunit